MGQIMTDYNAGTGTSVKTTTQIWDELDAHSNILSFHPKKVTMVCIEDIPPGISQETRQFLVWLQRQPYIEIVTKDGRFAREEVYDYQGKITSLEEKADDMRRAIATLEKEKRGMNADIETATQTIQDLKTSSASDDTAKARQISCLEKQVLDIRCEKNIMAVKVQNTEEENKRLNDIVTRNDGRFDNQQKLIRAGATINAKLATVNDTLIHENEKLSTENAVLVVEKRSLSAKLADERRRQGKQVAEDSSTFTAAAFFHGIMPPYLADIIKAPAIPVAKLVTCIMGRPPKRKHDDDGPPDRKRHRSNDGE